MTAPKPFPWNSQLRYTLTCRKQGGNWWKVTGTCIMLKSRGVEEIYEMRKLPGGKYTPKKKTLSRKKVLFNRVLIVPGYFIIGESMTPHTRTPKPWAFYNVFRQHEVNAAIRTRKLTGRSIHITDEHGRANAIRHAIAELFRNTGELPKPSALRKRLLKVTPPQNKLLTAALENISTLRDALGNKALWGELTQQTSGIIVKPPHGWKDKIISAILETITEERKGRFLLKLEII